MLLQIKRRSKSNSKPFIQLGFMMILTILTQTIMLIKTSVVASSFGVSVEMDAFNFANSIGTFIYSFIGTGITTILIPNLVNKDNKESINIFISVIYTIAFIILLLVQGSRKFIVGVLSTGSDEFMMTTCNIMFITLITQYIQSLTGTTNAIFQCSGKFNLPKFITLITSTILVVLVLVNSNITIYKYASFILITTIINVLAHIYLAIKDGYVFKYKIDLNNGEFKRMLRIFAPTVLSTGLYQVSLLIDSIISSRLGEGDISKLSYSNNIMLLINTVILSNIMVYFYPKIAEGIKQKDSQKNIFDLSILINCIMILMVLGFVLVGKNGIVILYERGKFTPDITQVVYSCTLIYIIGMPSNAFRDLIYRYFYAKEDTITPLKNSVIISCLNIFISVILSKYIGLYGIIWGTVITSYISLFMILTKFNEKFGFNYDVKNLILENIKLILSAIVTIFIVEYLKNILCINNILTSTTIYGVISILMYMIILYSLKSNVFKIKI